MSDQYDFSTVAPTRIRISENVSISELGQALEGSLIAIRLHPGGGFIIARRKPGERDRRLPPIEPPTPPRAA